VLSVSKVIAIDGPSGSGKSTLAKSLATKLGHTYIDTGAMYRALAYYFDQQGLNLDRNLDIKRGLANLKLEYMPEPNVLIKVNGEDVTKVIRMHKVSALASLISKIEEIREYLVNYQRNLVLENYCIMEGRDIGTNVFPNAFIKFFITASSQVRAKRRFKELEHGKSSLTYDRILEDIIDRDEQDRNRSLNPLKKAIDAIEIDTSEMSLDDVSCEMIKQIRQKINE
jgi:CMP/dCMP kinase